MVHPMNRACLVFAICALMSAADVSAQTPPPLDDFVALTSKDEKLAAAAAERLAPVWKNSYASMVLDLARFFRPAPSPGQPEIADGLPSGGDDPEGGSASRTAGQPFSPTIRTPESIIRDRLMRFLARQTGNNFGSDLKRWRKWSWSLPSDPHPQYAEFKARLYANVDPRMAAFFEGSTPPRIRLDEIDWGGVGVNGIPPLDHPKVAAAAQAGFMGDKNVVFGIVVNGEARAYPKRILAWHELALDTVGGVRLAVVYCTLCGTVIPYETVVDGRSFTLGTSGLLYRSNKLMFDAETRSLWSTIGGRPVVGPLAASSLVLKYRPVVTTTWKEWRAAHPATTVLSLDTGHQRDYGEGVAYRSYFSHDDLMFEVPDHDRRLNRKAEVVTFLAGTEPGRVPVALDVAFLKKNPLHHFSAAGTSFLALTTEGGANRIYRIEADRRFARTSATEVFDEQGQPWAIDEDRLRGPSGETAPRAPARRTFWFAWFSQFPTTVLIK